MQGLTELIFRRTYEFCFPMAISKAISPFLSLTHGNLTAAIEKIDDVLPERNIGSMAVVPQILGKETDEFVQLAHRLADLGYDEVNWNIGCPMRRVAGKHRGSGILPYPDEMRAVLDYVIPRIGSMRLSVKMRLGYKDPDEIFRLVPILNSYPIASVTIHARTGKQQYSGVCDIERYGAVLQQLQPPVIYNGDITTVTSYRHLLDRHPKTHDVMIGRGLLYDPTLSLRIQETITGSTPKEATWYIRRNVEFLSRLTAAVIDALPTDEAKLRKIKEYWCLMWRITSISETEARKVLRNDTLGKTLQAIDEILLPLQ